MALTAVWQYKPDAQNMLTAQRMPAAQFTPAAPQCMPAAQYTQAAQSIVPAVQHSPVVQSVLFDLQGGQWLVTHA